MSARTAALPIERRYLVRAWFIVSAVVIAATVVIAVALTTGRAEPAGSNLKTGTTGWGVDDATTHHGPIVLEDGTVCGQCR